MTTVWKTVSIFALAMMWCGSEALAAPVTFFGLDLDTGNTVPAGGNAVTARNNFLSNLTAVGNEDFSGLAVGTTTPLTLSFPGSSGGLTAGLSSSGGSVVVSNTNVVGLFPTSLPNYLDAGFGSTLSNDFSTNPISAFGFYGTDIADSGGDLVVDLLSSGGTTTSMTILTNAGTTNNNDVLFWGFYDTATTYSNIMIQNTSSGDRFGFDDMVIGDRQQVTPTPLPAALPFFATGLGMMGLLGWFRKRKNANAFAVA